MKKICLSRFLVFLLVWIAFTPSSWGGQVVTDDTRSWAKKVLEQEKSLPAVTGKNTLAVLYFHNKTGQKDLDPVQKGMTLMLITDLSTVKDLQVIERVRLQALTEEMGLGVSGLVEENTAPRVGKLLGAKWLVGGDIDAGKPELLSVQSNLLDVPTTQIVGQPSSEGKLPELFRIEKDILFGIIKLLKIKVTPEEEARLRKPCSTNTNALLALFRGIGASDAGQYEKATDFYEKALREDPNICIAREALSEIKDLGLIAVKKKGRELIRSLREDTSLTNQVTPKEEIRHEPTPKDIPTGITIQPVFP
jgi:TolB-like protein